MLSKKQIDKEFWVESSGKWDSHKAFDTISHNHVSCYFSDDEGDDCDIMVVECRDGSFFIEDNWGGDAKGAPPPLIHMTEIVTQFFYKTFEGALTKAKLIVSSVSKVDFEDVGWI